MNKVATSKGEPRINPATTKYILEQFYLKRRTKKDIWKDVSDRCSYGYVTALTRYPFPYVDRDWFNKLMDKYEKMLNNVKL